MVRSIRPCLAHFLSVALTRVPGNVDDQNVLDCLIIPQQLECHVTIDTSHIVAHGNEIGVS